jgi:hypothetical protein
MLYVMKYIYVKSFLPIPYYTWTRVLDNLSVRSSIGHLLSVTG